MLQGYNLGAFPQPPTQQLKSVMLRHSFYFYAESYYDFPGRMGIHARYDHLTTPPKVQSQRDPGADAFQGVYQEMIISNTLPETNIAPTNGWLEYYFPIGEAYFQGLR